MNILHIDCSPRPESHSRKLSAAILAKVMEVAPDALVNHRDLGFSPLPHALPDFARALASPAGLTAPGLDETLALSETLIRELEAADIIIIGTPMNNFTVPSVLKAWIDQVLRVGRTIMATPAGKVGMLRDRPVFVGIASGGVFTGRGANQPDFLTPYLSAALGCIGISQIQFVPVQATAFLDEPQARTAHAEALADLYLGVLTEPA